MHINILTRRIITIICAAALMFTVAFIPAPSVRAASTSELKDKISSYEQKEKELKDKISNLESDKKSANEIASALKEKIDNLENQISLVNDTIDALNDKIAKSESQIAAKEKEVEQAKATLKQRLRAIYIAGSNSELQVLLSADSYADYLAKAELMRGVTKHDTALMEKLNNDIKQINKLKEDIEADKADAKQMKAGLVDKQNELDADYKKAQSAYNSADSKQSDLQAESEEIAAAKKKVEAEWKAIIKAQSDSNKVMGSGGSSSSGHSGAVSSFGFVWPFQSSYYISCGYGQQSYRFHTGIDITCSGALGKPIYAAASGTVISAVWSSTSYGNRIIIDHGTKNGQSVSTLYAHCQTLLVSQGQEVSQGQLIAYCGSTGNSTGPHLHFEVRLDGDHINPLSCY